MFCPDCFKLLDDDNACTNPACPSYVGSDENIIETNILDENRMNETALENTINEDTFKQPKVNTINEDIFKQPKINTVSEEIFKQPKVNTVNKEVFKQPKVNTINEELFKQPKINTVSEEIFKQPKVNTVNKEVFKQPKVNTINEELFKQPKINTINKESIESHKTNIVNKEKIDQPKINTINKKEIITTSMEDSYDNEDFTKAVPIITESMINNSQTNIDSASEDDFTKAIPIITDSMLNNEELTKKNITTTNEDVVTDTILDDDFSEKNTRKENNKKSNSKRVNKEKEVSKSKDDNYRETPKLDDYFNDDLIDADELIDNSTDDETISDKEMLLAFVGKKKRSYYSKHIDTYLENPNFISWNFSSFFFTLWWFWHRKMYIPASIITLVRLGATQLPGMLEVVVKIGIVLFGGLLGNQLYLKSASKHIAKIKSDNSDLDKRSLLKAIKSEGGTTNAPIIIFIILVLAMIIALTFGLVFIANMLMGVGAI